MPSEFELERGLRNAVSKAIRDGNTTASVNSLRNMAEEALALENGFFVGHKKWKGESKSIIQDEHAKQTEPASSSPASQPKDAAAPDVATASQRVTKRASPDDGGAVHKRRRKTKVVVDSEGSNEDKSPAGMLSISTPPGPRSLLQAANEQRPKEADAVEPPTIDANGTEEKLDSGSEMSVVLDEPPKRARKQKKRRSPEAPAKITESESELSVLLDEEPKPIKKDGRADNSEKKSKKPASSTIKTKTGTDADHEEIKRLQSWLVKCGIRKLWGKELKPYDTSKTKIKHLKEMLADVGMTGRYSIEKANHIKEARELAADIEAVQEGAERWGKVHDNLDTDRDRPRKRLVRGTKGLAPRSSAQRAETPPPAVLSSDEDASD